MPQSIAPFDPSTFEPEGVPERARLMRWLPWLLLTAGLLATALVWWNSRSDQKAAVKREFETEAASLVRALESRLQATDQLLRGVGGLFTAAPTFDRPAFQAYVEAQQLRSAHPGVLGVGFASIVPAADLYAHVQAVRNEGFPNYTVLPNGDAPFLAPLAHMSPDSRAMGFDLLSEPIRRDAMERARTSRSAAMTGRIALAPETPTAELGLALFTPAFRHGNGNGDLVGWAYAPVSIRPFVENAFITGDEQWQNRLHVRIYDGRTFGSGSLLYDSRSDSETEAEKTLTAVWQMDFGGQSWSLRIEALPGYSSGLLTAANLRVLAGGTLLSVILAVLAHILMLSHHRVAEALEKSAKANENLAESKRRFRVLANAVPVLIWVSEADGRRTWFSRQWLDFTGCDPNLGAPYQWSDFIHPEDKTRVLQTIAEASGDGEPFSLEYRLAHIDGTYHWVMDSGTPRFNDKGELGGFMGSSVDINARKQAEAAVFEREALLRSIYDASSAAIFLVNPEGRIVHANSRMAEIFGQPLRSIIGNEYVALIAPPERDSARKKMQAILARGTPMVNVERLYWRPDGKLFWGLLTGRPLLNSKGENCGLVGVVSDITARKEAEAGMALASRVFESCHEGIFITDAQKRIVSVNEAFTKITGFPASEAIGKPLSWLASKRHHETFFAGIAHALESTDHWEGEIWNKHRDGPIYPAWTAITRVTRPDGGVANYVAIFTDISERKKTEARMHHLAHYDYLTDLPNRALLIERMSLLLSTARRYGKHFAVLFADLDLFKQVNDEYGHNIGDALLIEVARRLKAITRDSDTVSRQGGDEFVILVPELHEPVKLLELGEKLRSAIAQPYLIQGHRLTVAVSIGIAIYPRDGDSVDDIMRSADAAMYRAKNAGHNKIRFATNGSAPPADAARAAAQEEAGAGRPLYLVRNS